MFHNVAHFLTQQAATQAEAVAVRAPIGRRVDGLIHYAERSFLELDQEASATAYYFSVHGIRRGSRVLLMVRPGMDLIRIVFALFKVGAVPIVVDPGMGLKKFLRCVSHSQPDALIGINSAIWISRLFRSSFRTVSIKIPIGPEFSKKIAHFTIRGAYPVVESKPDELAAVLFTSGSTGPAKGVCYAHGTFMAQVEAIRHQYNIDDGEVDLPMLPVFALFNPALGMCTIVPEMDPSRPVEVDPAKIVQAIRQNAVTNSFGSPALWTKIARYCQIESINLPSVRRILIAGAPVSPALMAQMRMIVPDGEIHTPYGATEALPVTSISSTEVLEQTAKRTNHGEGTCVGRPLPNVFLRIIKPIDGVAKSIKDAVDLPVGMIGEIIVKGPSVTKGYDRLPEADSVSKIFGTTEYWHRMGDMGWIDTCGRLWFCGRKVERVTLSDDTLYTDCCEAIFNNHVDVFRSALIDIGHGIPAIVVEPENGSYPKTKKARVAFIQQLRELALNHTLTEKIENFFFAKSFPVDSRHNAKIHRLSLSRKFASK
ncbi:MAG: fatty acid CoA ligase family protein [Verrucomicrobiota bacterium]|nr:fatty acid CoA ligase family protein [Verrucomicrobiota bacterium]